MTAPATATNTGAIRTFIAYRLVSRGYFHLSILFIFLLQSGHSVLSVTVVLASYGVAMAALTPFTPRLVARLGAGRALVGGELAKATGLVLLAVAGTSVPLAILAQVINATGFALAMSADSALINRLADGPTVRALQTSTQSLMFIALLVSGVAGGALYEADRHLPLVAGALAAIAAAGLALVLSRHDSRQAPAPAAPVGGERRMNGLEIRWVTYYVMTRGFMLGTFIGLLPYLIFEIIGVSVLTLTIYLAAYSLAAFLSARYLTRLLPTVSAPVFAGVTAAILLLALVVFAFSTSSAPVVVAMVLLGAASGCVRPATMAQLVDAAKQFRSGALPGWLLSRMEGVFGICNAAVILIGGLISYYWTFKTAMLTLCGIYIGLQAIAEVFVRRRLTSDAHEHQPAL